MTIMTLWTEQGWQLSQYERARKLMSYEMRSCRLGWDWWGCRQWDIPGAAYSLYNPEKNISHNIFYDNIYQAVAWTFCHVLSNVKILSISVEFACSSHWKLATIDYCTEYHTSEWARHPGASPRIFEWGGGRRGSWRNVFQSTFNKVTYAYSVSDLHSCRRYTADCEVTAVRHFSAPHTVAEWSYGVGVARYMQVVENYRLWMCLPKCK